jgi:hypothetical protein
MFALELNWNLSRLKMMQENLFQHSPAAFSLITPSNHESLLKPSFALCGRSIYLIGQRLRTHPDFRPSNAATTFTIAQIAARGGSPAMARALLVDFASRYPGEPSVAAPASLARDMDAESR